MFSSFSYQEICEVQLITNARNWLILPGDEWLPCFSSSPLLLYSETVCISNVICCLFVTVSEMEYCFRSQKLLGNSRTPKGFVLCNGAQIYHYLKNILIKDTFNLNKLYKCLVSK